MTNLERQEENYYQTMLEKTEVEKEIIQYVKSVQGAVFEFGRKEYVIFANAGLLGEKKHQSEHPEAAAGYPGRRGSSMNAGIGMGNHCVPGGDECPRCPCLLWMKRNRQEIYCINAENVMEGPFGQEQQLKYELISSDPKIRDIAARTGLSARSVLKIMAIAQRPEELCL